MGGPHIGILFPVSISWYFSMIMIIMADSHRPVILHLPARFRSNRTIGGGDGGHRVGNVLLGSGL